MKLWDKLTLCLKIVWPRRRLRKSEKEIRQVHSLSHAVVREILAEVGKPVLCETLEKLEKNRKEKGHADYTSLAEIWLSARKRCEELKKKCH